MRILRDDPAFWMVVVVLLIGLYSIIVVLERPPRKPPLTCPTGQVRVTYRHPDPMHPHNGYHCVPASVLEQARRDNEQMKD